MVKLNRLLGVILLSVSAAGCSDEPQAQAEAQANASASSSIDMEPGLWEITTTMEATGMPFAMPPTTTRQCLTEEDFVPQSDASAPGCEIANLQVVDNTVSYGLKCSNEGGETLSSAKITYAGTTMEGSFQMKMSGQMSMEMTSKLSGKRIGPCE